MEVALWLYTVRRIGGELNDSEGGLCMKNRFWNSLVGAFAASGLFLAGWGIVVSPDEVGKDISKWGWTWSLQAQEQL